MTRTSAFTIVVASCDVDEIEIENVVEHELLLPIIFLEQKDRRGAFTAIAKINKVEVDASRLSSNEQACESIVISGKHFLLLNERRL